MTWDTAVQSRRAEWMAQNPLSKTEWTMDERFKSMFRPGAAEGGPRALAGAAPAAAETQDHEGKSTNDARNMMYFILAKDGIPRVTADPTDLQRRLELVQHLLRILSETRLDDFLGGTALKLDLEKVRKLLKRYKSDLDLRLTIPAEYASVARYHEVVELVVYAEEQRFRRFALFLFDRFDLVQGSLADFLKRSAKHDFASLESSPDTRLAIRRALGNFSLAMLVVFGIPCMDAVQEARDFLVKDHLLHGIDSPNRRMMWRTRGTTSPRSSGCSWN